MRLPESLPSPSLRRSAGDNEWIDRAARAGLVAFGVVHLVLGWLAVQLAFGDRQGSASTSGAVHTLARQPLGIVLVALIALGMALLMVWQVVEAAFGHREHDGLHRWRSRATSAGKAIVYATIAFSAARTALSGSGGGSGGGEQQTDTLTARVMDLPGGQVLVGVIGLAIIAVGVMLVRKGVTDRFLKDLDHGGGGTAGVAYTWLGRVGYSAKGVSLGVVGILFGYAALTHRAAKSGGLDQALSTVLSQPFGPVLLTAIGLGIACFGAFCLAWARHLDR